MTKPNRTTKGTETEGKKERVTRDWLTNKKRTSITLSPKLAEWAYALAEEGGYDNFTAYISELIRRDKERTDEKKSRLAGGNPVNPDPGN